MNGMLFTLRCSPSSESDAAVGRWVAGRQTDRTHVGVEYQVRSNLNQCDIRLKVSSRIVAIMTNDS